MGNLGGELAKQSQDGAGQEQAADLLLILDQLPDLDPARRQGVVGEVVVRALPEWLLRASGLALLPSFLLSGVSLWVGRAGLVYLVPWVPPGLDVLVLPLLLAVLSWIPALGFRRYRWHFLGRNSGLGEDLLRLAGLVPALSVYAGTLAVLLSYLVRFDVSWWEGLLSLALASLLPLSWLVTAVEGMILERSGVELLTWGPSQAVRLVLGWPGRRVSALRGGTKPVGVSRSLAVWGALLAFSGLFSVALSQYLGSLLYFLLGPAPSLTMEAMAMLFSTWVYFLPICLALDAGAGFFAFSYLEHTRLIASSERALP